MSRYTWKTKDLLRSLDKVQKLMDKEKDPAERARLMLYYDTMNSTIYDTFIMRDANIPLSKLLPSRFSSFLADQRYLSLMWPIENAMIQQNDLFNTAGNNRDSINDQIEKITGAHVGKTKAVSICYDFYKDLDEELFEHFKRFYDMRFNHLRFSKPNEDGEFECWGQQNYLYGTNESFIEITGTDDPMMTTSMIHEAAHHIDSSMNPDNYITDDYFYEVISTFMELVSIYKRTGGFDELFYQDSIIYNFEVICDYIDEANVYANLMELYRNHNYHLCPEFYEEAREKYKMNKKRVDSALRHGAFGELCYPVSASLAYYFFNIYRQDEKKGIEELKKFIRTVDRDRYIPLVLSDEVTNVVNNEVKTLLTDANECFLRHK